jgi:nucleotide-binding universal stress UspA family protein
MAADGDRWGASSVSPMERKIIVGYDGSPGARDALVLGGLLGELASRPLGLAAFFDDDPVRYARAEADGEFYAYPDAHRALEQAPVAAEIERRVIHGRSPASALSMLAEERDAAAIVVGSAHHPGASRAAARRVCRDR